MKSPINWALLALVIERPSYAYELAQRFERTYDGVLSLSSISHVYTALDALSSRSLVEEVPGSREARQPRPLYRATAEGLEHYEAWLIRQVHGERRRQRPPRPAAGGGSSAAPAPPASSIATSRPGAKSPPPTPTPLAMMRSPTALLGSSARRAA